MKTLPICSALLAAVAFSTAAAAEQTTVLRCGAVLDVVGGETLGAHTISVKGGRISAIEAGYPELAEETATELDLSAQTCLPGLMDMHVHLSQELSPKRYAERFTLSDADLAFLAADYARKTLAAGFTTVRNVGDQRLETIALRNAIAKGIAIGPRVFTAGKSLATTGGHADSTNGWRRDLAGDPGPIDGVVNGVAEAREGVRQRYKEGADLIKITATGGVLSNALSGDNAQFSVEELDAIIATANDYGMHVAAHAHGAEGMRRAIEAGVHSIEHGTYMDDDIIALMKERGTWYVPTIFAGKFVAEKAEEPGYFPPLVEPKARRIGPLIQETFARAHAAGVRIAFGTDCGVGPHGENAREFVYMVEAGMSPADAIRSATINAAELLGQSEQLGKLEVGYIADIIAVDGDPLEDVAVLQAVGFVMREGEVFTP